MRIISIITNVIKSRFIFMFAIAVRGTAETSRFVISQSENAVRRSHHRRARSEQLSRYKYVNPYILLYGHRVPINSGARAHIIYYNRSI